jgi:sec-independent protein translocase protein TatB
VFGVGGPEMMVILVLALILIGPDKLPKVAKTIGAGMRDLRRAANLAQAELRETVDELMRDVDVDALTGKDDASVLREQARKKAQNALAAARATGAPPSPNDGSSGPLADDAPDTGAMAAEASAAQTGTAGAIDDKAADASIPQPAPSDADAAAEGSVGATDDPQKARRRRDLNDLLAAEATRFDESRARIANSGVDGAIARGTFPPSSLGPTAPAAQSSAAESPRPSEPEAST